MGLVQVLHVEDDTIQRALVAHYLTGPSDHSYVLTGVESENEAVETFQRGGFDLVILDYQLSQGNGLDCLRRLRRLDSLVPVIALSGIATSTIAGELIEAGADDYLSKKSMDKHTLTHSIGAALARAHGVRAEADAIASRRK